MISMFAQLYTCTPFSGGPVFSDSVLSMPHKLHRSTSIYSLLPSSLNAPLEGLVQRSSDPSAMRTYLRTAPGSRLVDELEELMRSIPVRQIHRKRHSTQDWVELSRRIHAEIVLPWSPRRLLPQEQYRYRNDTKRRLAVIYILEEVAKRLHPSVHAPLDELLLLARLDFSIRFWRTFRMNDLPNEIVSNILHMVVWSSKTPKESMISRMKLAKTCSHWRQLVIHDPTLWNNFKYMVDSPSALYISKLAVQRCNAAPIDIHITDEPTHPITAETLDEILAVLTPRMKQLRTFSVSIRDWELSCVVLRWLAAFGTQNIPCNLRRLEIYRPGPPYILPNGADSDPIPLLGGANAPFLRHLTVSGIRMDWTKSKIQDLTTLDIRRIPLDSAPDMELFRNILDRCPDLDRLILLGAGPKWRPITDIQHSVTLPKLRSLILADFALSYAQFVLSAIRAPNVKELALYGFTGEDYSQLFEELTGQFPKVRLLSMISIELEQSEQTTMALLGWFASMPEVRFLRITHMNAAIWEAFKFDPATNTEYPPLIDNIITNPTHIVFSHLNCLDVCYTPPDCISDFLSRRAHAGFMLEKVYIDKAYYDRVDVIKREEFKNFVGNVITDGYPSKVLDEEQLLM